MKTATQARDNEFIAICKEIISRNIASGRRSSLVLVIDEAIHRRPRCHYVSYERASRILHYIDACGSTAIRSRLSALKWLELYNQVKETMNGPRGLSFDKALSFVLSFKRPSRFYITHARALRLLRPHITTTISYQTHSND